MIPKQKMALPVFFLLCLCMPLTDHAIPLRAIASELLNISNDILKIATWVPKKYSRKEMFKRIFNKPLPKVLNGKPVKEKKMKKDIKEKKKSLDKILNILPPKVKNSFGKIYNEYYDIAYNSIRVENTLFAFLRSAMTHNKIQYQYNNNYLLAMQYKGL